jgi:hypothetical protein
MTDRELMQMALDVMEAAIKAGDWEVDGACDPDWVLSALHARLAQPEPEPVAWIYKGNLHPFDPSDWAEEPVRPLYTTPSQLEWQGLTDDEINTAAYNNHPLDGIRAFARAVESKLKEKNGF